MPKGPSGQMRPADAIGRAVMIARIATGEIEDTTERLSSAAAEMGRKGGAARAADMTPERRAEIAKADCGDSALNFYPARGRSIALSRGPVRTLRLPPPSPSYHQARVAEVQQLSELSPQFRFG